MSDPDPRYVKVLFDVPPDVPYSRIRGYLQEKVAAGAFDEYEEGCLAQ